MHIQQPGIRGASLTEFSDVLTLLPHMHITTMDNSPVAHSCAG